MSHGVAVSLLNRYIKHHKIQKGDASTACNELLSRGRPNKVKNIVTIMAKPVKIAKASIKSRHTQKMFTKDAKKLLQQSQINALAPVPNYSKSTWTRAYISSYGAEKIKCSESYSKRSLSIMDWRNPVGCAPTFFCCLCSRCILKSRRLQTVRAPRRLSSILMGTGS